MKQIFKFLVAKVSNTTKLTEKYILLSSLSIAGAF